jgi:catechol 2,3-dioxygenase-like lactoylglutathione lyase family enzyme
MEVNGIAHIFLTASNFERSREFYRKLLPFLGLKPIIDSDQVYYCIICVFAPASARPTASGWNSTTFRARACWPDSSHSGARLFGANPESRAVVGAGFRVCARRGRIPE